MNRSNRDIDQILRRIRAEVTRLRTTDSSRTNAQIPRPQPYRLENLDAFASAFPADLLSNPQMRTSAQPALTCFDPIAYQPAFKQSTDGRYRVRDLLVYHDRAFLNAAYWAILHRAPDRGGLETYLQHLRDGISKVEILGLMRYSPEGRLAAVEVAGLKVPFALSRICHWPVVGPTLRLVTAFLKLPEMERRQRIFEDRVIALMEETQANFQDSLRRITHALRDLDDSFDHLTAVVASKPGREALNGIEISIAALNTTVNALRGTVEKSEVMSEKVQASLDTPEPRATRDRGTDRSGPN